MQVHCSFLLNSIISFLTNRRGSDLLFLFQKKSFSHPVSYTANSFPFGLPLSQASTCYELQLRERRRRTGNSSRASKQQHRVARLAWQHWYPGTKPPANQSPGKRNPRGRARATHRRTGRGRAAWAPRAGRPRPAAT